MPDDQWTLGDAYEEYVGRWSRRVAVEFVRRLAMPAGQRWLDVGCGTGALTETVLQHAAPSAVIGMDTAVGYLAQARARITDARATFCVGDARFLPLHQRTVDAVVSGLALNFVPDPAQTVGEFVRVVRPGGLAAAYVWDYAEGMAMMRYFWDAAVTLDPAARDLVEGVRFPICRPDPLRRLWTDAGIDRVRVEAIGIPTVFADFDDYWRPFLGGQGPAPGYAMSLPEQRRAELRDLLQTRLPAAGRSIPLTASAWAVWGTLPERG